MGVKDVYQKKGISKSGNPYTMLCVVFENGYTLQVFLNAEREIILKDVPVRN